MKIIFLDVDGVLNCLNTEERVGCFIGIDDLKVFHLRDIVNATNAQIVLCSSWKLGWEKELKSQQDREANYLDKMLAAQGLHILDKTFEPNGSSRRGEGIKLWMSPFKEGDIESFVILDDEVFDYAQEGLLPHLVQSSFYAEQGGLTAELAALAIKILNEGPGETQAIPEGFTICSNCIHKDDCDYRESRDGCYNGEEI